MGLFSRRKKNDEVDAGVADLRPGEPGGSTVPQGDGPVGLADRATPSHEPAPDTNQGKTEPMPASQGQSAPGLGQLPGIGQDGLAPGDDGQGTPGSADPQAPSHPLAGDRPAATTGTMAGERPSPDAMPTGSAFRAPGSQGESPEPVETDTATAASRMHPGSPAASTERPTPSPGDAHGVSVPSVESAEGTSEDTSIAHGVRATAVPPPAAPDGEVDTR